MIIIPVNFFQSKDEIENKIKNASKVLFFLDYDGTLAPFHEDPDLVKTSKEMLHLLREIKKHPKAEIIIISGRMMNEIKQRVTLDDISFAAIHGLHIELNNGMMKQWSTPSSSKELMQKIKDDISKKYQSQTGFVIEDKNSAVAFHYRKVPENKKPEMIETIENIIHYFDSSQELDLIMGAEVIEIRSKTMDKGLAVEFIKNHFSKHDVLSCYVGDDTTDEDAFDVLCDDDITVFVRNNSMRSTKARFWIESQQDVVKVLQMFNSALHF